MLGHLGGRAQFLFVGHHPHWDIDRRFRSATGARGEGFMRLYLLRFFTIAVSISMASTAPNMGTLRGTVRDGGGAIIPGGEGRNPGTLGGVVRDGSGAILPDASILIQHWQPDPNNLSRVVAVTEPIIYADNQGRFSVDLPAGLYDVFIAYPSLSPWARLVKVSPGKTSSFDCELAFSPLVKMIE